jgi:hypothetical protein
MVHSRSVPPSPANEKPPPHAAGANDLLDVAGIIRQQP